MLPTMPEISQDEVRDLIAKGWTPPADAMEAYRHLLRPFYDSKGLTASPGEKLDEFDCKNIAALIAVFDHFAISVPAAPKTEEGWRTVLRAYVAEHDRFTTEEAVGAVGWDWSRQNEQAICDALEGMGLFSIRMESDLTRRWTKRKAA